MNLKIPSGSASTPASSLLASILQDAGVVMPQVEGRLTFIPIRPTTGDVPEFTDDVVLPPDIERVVDRGDNGITRVVFSFTDEVYCRYAAQDIPFDDDSEIEHIQGIKSQNVPISTVTCYAVANKVARRRSMEVEVDTTITIQAIRGASLLCPGQVFHREALGSLRVISIKPFDDSPMVNIECMPDIYAVPDTDDFLTEPVSGGGGQQVAPAADKAFDWIELPSDISSTTAISVVRVRAHDQMSESTIYISADGVSYTEVGTQNYAASGGKLLDAVSATTGDVLATGPTFEADNPDALGVLDLSGDSASWMGGRQIALIGAEIFFLESITLQAETAWAPSTAVSIGDAVLPPTSTGLRYVCTTGGTTDTSAPNFHIAAGATVTDGSAVWTAHNFRYQMNNLIRARFDSVAAAHSIGDQVYITDQTQQGIITGALMQPGTDLRVKSVPSNNGRVVDIATITAVTHTITGKATGLGYRTDIDGNYRISATGENRTTAVESGSSSFSGYLDGGTP